MLPRRDRRRQRRVEKPRASCGPRPYAVDLEACARQGRHRKRRASRRTRLPALLLLFVVDRGTNLGWLGARQDDSRLQIRHVLATNERPTERPKEHARGEGNADIGGPVRGEMRSLHTTERRAEKGRDASS